MSFLLGFEADYYFLFIAKTFSGTGEVGVCSDDIVLIILAFSILMGLL